MNNKELIMVHDNYQKFRKEIETKRNDTLEEVAIEFEKMKVFEADTMASIAVHIRSMKK
jgi:hypothetical protein